jgi:hypothetical protein
MDRWYDSERLSDAIVQEGERCYITVQRLDLIFIEFFERCGWHHSEKLFTEAGLQVWLLRENK